MRWSSSGRDNIDDMRGASGGGGFRAVPLGIGGFIVVALLSMYTGIDFFSLLGGGQANAPSSSVGTSGSVNSSPTEEKLVDFVNAVAEDVQDTWENVLGGRYERTRVVLFRDQIQSTCGFAQSATGPFYCPGDHKVYLDLGFFDELQRRFGAPGDFAQAYVLAHEFGHHIQALTGTESQMRQAQRADPCSVECAVGPTRASGRLLCRRLGAFSRAAGPGGPGQGGARTRRRRGRAACRSGNRRRSPAEAGDWPRDA